jgi:hypothetical protein
VTPEQHEQQRLWVAQSLQAEVQRHYHHDTYPRRVPQSEPVEPAPTEAAADAE